MVYMKHLPRVILVLVTRVMMIYLTCNGYQLHHLYHRHQGGVLAALQVVLAPLILPVLLHLVPSIQDPTTKVVFLQATNKGNYGVSDKGGASCNIFHGIGHNGWGSIGTGS